MNKLFLFLKNHKLVPILSLIGIVVFVGWSKMVVYPDEIAATIWTSRSTFDGWFRSSVYSACTSTSYVKIPLSLYPVAATYSLINYINTYSQFRNLFLILFVLIFLSYFFIRLTDSKKDAPILWAVLFTLLSGTTISSIAIFRPELVCTITILVTLAIYLRKDNVKSTLSLLFLSLVIVHFFLMSIYIHPKGFFLFPFVFLILLFLLKEKPSLLILTILFAGIQSILYFKTFHSQYINCPEIPALEKAMNSFNINPLMFFSNTKFFLKEVLAQIEGRSFTRFFTDFSFSTEIYYLPKIENIKYSNIPNIIFSFLVSLFFIKLIIRVLSEIKYLTRLLSGNEKNKRSKNLEINFIFLSLLIPLLSSLFINKVQAFYDVGYSLFLIGILLTIPNRTNPRQTSIMNEKQILLLSVICFIFSYYIILEYIRPAYRAGWGYPGFAYGGVSLKSEEGRYKEYLNVAKLCGVKNDTRNLALDEESYLYFKTTNYAKSIPYIWAVEKVNRLDWYKKNTSFAIGRCSQLQEQLGSDAEKLEIYKINNSCCIRF
jgi:hypothetical protein